MSDNWKDYQEEAATFFRSLGLTANTDVTLDGVRTTHDVDVFVEIDMAGFSVRWIIECKHWKKPINKLHVLGLREIVADIGADRGIILCETGFQSGAIEAANLTNVQVTSLKDLRNTSSEAISSFRLKELVGRTAVCRQRYWDMGKTRRIKAGLRGDLFDTNIYNGSNIVEVVEKYLGLCFGGKFPITVDLVDDLKVSKTLSASPVMKCNNLPESFDSPTSVLVVLEPLISELEYKLDAAMKL